MPAEYADSAVAAVPPDIFHVDVENAVLEGVQEANVIDALIGEMGGVEVKAESRMTVEGINGALGGGDVEGDLGRVNFQGEVDVDAVEFIQDRFPAAGEIFKAVLPVLLGSRREGVEAVPDAGAGEAVDDGGVGSGRRLGTQ